MMYQTGRETQLPRAKQLSSMKFSTNVLPLPMSAAQIIQVILTLHTVTASFVECCTHVIIGHINSAAEELYQIIQF